MSLFEGFFLKTTFPLFPFFELTKKVFFQFFWKCVNFTVLVMKTILNKFINSGQVKDLDWNNFFWL